MTTSSPADKPKPGPKGKVLEPYAKEILLRAREGQSMQEVVNWLAEPPRNIAITRQAVHQWLKARIRKLVKLNAEFANTGVGAPFQASDSPVSRRPPEGAGAADAGAGAPMTSAASAPMTSATPRTPPAKRVDVSEFLVDEADLNRAQNPLIPKP